MCCWSLASPQSHEHYCKSLNAIRSLVHMDLPGKEKKTRRKVPVRSRGERIKSSARTMTETTVTARAGCRSPFLNKQICWRVVSIKQKNSSIKLVFIILVFEKPCLEMQVDQHDAFVSLMNMQSCWRELLVSNRRTAP